MNYLPLIAGLICFLSACQSNNASKNEPDNRNFDVSDTTKRSSKTTQKTSTQDSLIKRTEAYSDIDTYNQDRAKVRLGKLYGYIDRDSFEIIKPSFEEASRFQDSLAKVRKGDKYGLIDLEGKEIIPFEYDQLGQVKDSMLAAKKGKLYGFLHTKRAGKEQEIVPPRYEWAGVFMEKRAKVMLKGKWTFIDEKGKEIVPMQYDGVRDFREGLAAVWVNFQWGYINTAGKMVIPPQFDQALDFEKGKAQVTVKDKKFYINTAGKEVSKTP
ncbi:MAG: WG repeat-containing protein [Bacteroidetes bacterium]|nr:MAG: WG repeat-containing protein [Bacteroidota bacterium]